jgi:serine protease Do
MDYGARDRPAYVERVRPDSPAQRAGIRPNDLIMTVNGERVATCDDFFGALGSIPPEQRIDLVLKRGDELLPVQLEAEPETP